MNSRFSAVLLDLDGTLLDNHMATFLPHYFERLAARVSHLVPANQFTRHLLEASGAMLSNDGRISNEEAFARAFFPLAGHSREELEPIFDVFYRNDFPSLQRHTRRKPEARALVEAAFQSGAAVVIATNPLFPATAITQRLEWAGVADYPYDLVTTYENSRACKPNLLYFELVLEAIGQSAASSIVIGDEDMDMVAAHLGCTTFLVPGPSTELSPTTPQPTWRGSLVDAAVLLR
jgi:FMN phosphatase YigB (HAD superfamily)